MGANDRQVGGEHYKAGIQHWDIVAQHDLDYFQGQITKYVMRWKKKNGVQDLEKARHFLDKYIELQVQKEVGEPRQCAREGTVGRAHYDKFCNEWNPTTDGEPTSAYVNQDR